MYEKASDKENVELARSNAVTCSNLGGTEHSDPALIPKNRDVISVFLNYSCVGEPVAIFCWVRNDPIVGSVIVLTKPTGAEISFIELACADVLFVRALFPSVDQQKSHNCSYISPSFLTSVL